MMVMYTVGMKIQRHGLIYQNEQNSFISVPEGSVVVEEPPIPEEPEVKVEDQTAAVVAALRLGDG